MASSLITSHFDELKRELEDFGELFTEWNEQRRRVLIDDKEAYLRTLAEEQDTVEALKKQYQQIQAEKQHIVNALQAEEQEREAYLRENQDYVVQRDALKQRLAVLKKETEQLEGEIMKESKILEDGERLKEFQRGQKMVDLELYRSKMGLEIQPEPNNCSTFIFTQVDPGNPHRPFRFTLDYSDGMTFRLSQCHPILACHQGLVEELNGDRNFLKFVGRMRASFVGSL